MSVVSVRVDKRVKKLLEKAGVNVSAEVRRHLEELAWRVELEEALQRMERLLADVPPAEKGFSAKTVREDRESH
ncbi:MAG: VapB-type antitoxin [Candidatus Caldarchaeum sp.]|nr:VapB-type antitoxin [Candidatus Caldarchaeum sp.]MCS7136978.1 VapB-type antitoxin [Candidatus Caldarchaeum sp.]MDW7978545.1 hypothetical protein [Candidatus Caldarchaeum sp.]MDW8359691.1 hypothetical protein [Candidatus Caldarchaeum sp.]